MRIALILLASVALVACGKREAGGDATRTFPGTGFDRVTLAGPDDIQVVRGSAFRIEADADAAVLDQIKVAVVDGELTISREDGSGGWRGWLFGRRRAVVRITLPTLRGITIVGAGNVEVTDPAAPVFVGTVEGAGNLIVRGLETRNAAFKLSGAGNLDLSGKAGNTTLQVSGAGNVSAERLETRDIEVTMSGVGNIDARASGQASVTMSGVGAIAIAGTDDCRINTTGVGSVKCAK